MIENPDENDCPAEIFNLLFRSRLWLRCLVEYGAVDPVECMVKVIGTTPSGDKEVAALSLADHLADLDRLLGDDPMPMDEMERHVEH